MLSVDWLSMTLLSMEPISHERLSVDFSDDCDEVKISRLLHNPKQLGRWDWKPKRYGTKQFRTIWEISTIDSDGCLEPFGVLCSEPTTPSMNPCMCSFKVENHVLYRQGEKSWLDMVRMFLADYNFKILSISRCDLAADFIYLRGRVSGPKLIENIKSFRWWKIGKYKVAEHYRMPYELKTSSWSDNADERPLMFFQRQKVAARVETMTFGSMSSDAQVCVYDKTLELNRSSVKISADDDAPAESAKEYIRDCHKAAGVFSPKLHTWRIEIRLKSKSLFLFDNLRMTERPLELADLEPASLFETFRAAANKYFKLVDASINGSEQITPAYCQKMASHKNRLPEVELFTPSSARVTFTKKKYHEPANKFHRAVIKRLDEIGDRARRVPCHYTKEGDSELIPKLIQRIEPLAKQMKSNRQMLGKALTALANVAALLESGQGDVATEDIELICQVKEMLERHYRTESPQFIRNCSIMLEKYASRMTQIESQATDKPIRVVRSAHPEDSSILLEASNILRSIYVDVVFDERQESKTIIYEKAFVDAIQLINSSDDPPAQVLDLAYQVIESKLYLSTERVIEAVKRQKGTPFYQLLICGWDLLLWHRDLHHCGCSWQWRPPTLNKFEIRSLTTKLLTI